MQTYLAGSSGFIKMLIKEFNQAFVKNIPKLCIGHIAQAVLQTFLRRAKP